LKLRLVVIAAARLLIAVTAFVLLDSGAPGDATCERSRFVRSSGFSVWPPGARCSYGEPVRTDIIVNGWFAAVVGVLGLFAVARAALISRTQSA
jgi:hypothetical protein